VPRATVSYPSVDGLNVTILYFREMCRILINVIPQFDDSCRNTNLYGDINKFSAADGMMSDDG
jgi:hypothetical protein